MFSRIMPCPQFSYLCQAVGCWYVCTLYYLSFLMQLYHEIRVIWSINASILYFVVKFNSIDWYIFITVAPLWFVAILSIYVWDIWNISLEYLQGDSFGIRYFHSFFTVCKIITILTHFFALNVIFVSECLLVFTCFGVRLNIFGIILLWYCC